MFDLSKITKEYIKNLTPDASVRDEYLDKEMILLDANENPFGSPVDVSFQGDGKNKTKLNRYSDPTQSHLKEKLAKKTGLSARNIFLGNGSNEAIDVLFRVFCYTEIDNVIICPPTYEMYETFAHINGVNAIKVPLTPEEFQLDLKNILKRIDQNTKLIFICCPNNPTGGSVKWNSVKTILENFNGIVVVDEAYINFAEYKSLIPELSNFPNLVILQTFSKAWGLAGLRIGVAFASKEIIEIFDKIKPSCNINSITQKLVLDVLDKRDKVNTEVKLIVQEREKLSSELKKLSCVIKVYPSEANFLLVKTKDPGSVFNYLLSKRIIVRDISEEELCVGCLRITVGTQQQNELLVNILKEYK
jgi:histidinol-phosphate aminotransferase